MPVDRAPDVPILGLSRDQAAASTSLSVRTVDALIADRTSGFPVARINGRVVIPVRELADWLRDRAAEAQ